MKREIMEVVAMSFETGHFSFDSFEDFKREYPDFGKEGWEYYCELVNLGPVGFYEEFKEDYDFDPMFVSEYGHYYDDDEDDERNISSLFTLMSTVRIWTVGVKMKSSQLNMRKST